MGVASLLGRKVRILIPGDYGALPTGRVVRAAIRPGHLGGILLVELEEEVSDRRGQVKDLLLAGIGMNAIEELVGIPRRPAGIPVTVAVWRWKSTDVFEDWVTSLSAPPGRLFMGHGQIELTA